MRWPGSGSTDTLTDMIQAKARARSNIALVKYWGKADAELNTPAVGSVSITLDRLWTDTEVTFDPALARDELILDGRQKGDQLARVSACLDLLRAIAGTGTHARVVSDNNFPTAAGLASSASGFAALVGAADAALGLDLPDRQLSVLARRGSGSAARSIFGGYVLMHRGVAEDGEDSFAEPLIGADDWPLVVVVAVTERAAKPVSSGAGMTRSAESSPYYAQWVNSHPADLATARSAILARDFAALGEIAELSCLKMHAAAMTTQPPLIYWNPATLECMHRVRQLREEGIPVFFTIDAGPQLKAVCEPDALAAVEAALGDAPGVRELIATGLGPGLETFR
jgi:diphosphomevalonate decarboxylase